MISTKYVINIKDVPEPWAFKFYCKLSVLPNGKEVKIKSMFNHKDTNPSFVVYYNSRLKRHMFKDFSVNIGGGITDLVSQLYSLSIPAAAQKIVEDYTTFLKNDGIVPEEPIHERFVEVSSYNRRIWYDYDARYWTSYGIGSDQLKKYNVVPFESFVMRVTQNNISIDNHFKIPQSYGYFQNDGTLYKIYQPKSKSKFMKLGVYIQGSEQLTFQKPYLLIGSSLKDIMTLDSMGFSNIEYIAPDSESIMIPQEVLNSYKFKYKKIITMFDDDPTGLVSMNKYKEQYDIEPVHFQTGFKDVSDTVKSLGVNKTRELLITQLKKVIHG